MSNVKAGSTQAPNCPISGSTSLNSVSSAKMADPTGAVPYIETRLSPLATARCLGGIKVGTTASRAGWRNNPRISTRTITRNNWERLETNSSVPTNTALPKSHTTMVVFRFQRSATTPPTIPASMPGRNLATREMIIATVEPSPSPPIRAANARVAKILTQSPRLEMLLAHHSLAKGPRRIRSRPRISSMEFTSSTLLDGKKSRIRLGIRHSWPVTC